MSATGIVPQPPQTLNIVRASAPAAVDTYRELLADLARTSNECGEFTLDDGGDVLFYIHLTPDEAAVLGVPEIEKVWIAFSFPERGKA
jgi:hypothetical protein